MDNDSFGEKPNSKPPLSSFSQNEGSMEFRNIAYSLIWKEVFLIQEKDCQGTKEDIRRIFHDVALHDMKQHNESIRNGAKKGNPVMPEQMPGLHSNKLLIVRLSNTLLPTDLTTSDGIIRINENFLKLMSVMGEWGLKRPFGAIPAYEDNRLFHDDIIGDMYESIIYSLAIHTIRGHFSINERGKSVFTANEFTAQSQRGRKHGYVNTLAIMYYWILLLERHQYVTPRARIFMRKYPHIFKHLTNTERYNLPFHLMHFVDHLYKTEALPHEGRKVVRTGETRKSVNVILNNYTEKSSNDGLPENPSESAENEGGIHLLDKAFSGVYADIKGVEGDEIASTKRLIRTIFRNVAMHEVMGHNDKTENPNYFIQEDDMPGIGCSGKKISFEDLSPDLMLPTDITTSDGKIRINENFAKMMYVFMINPEKTQIGEEFSDLGKSIIYSLAIHTIRGHFKIVPQGFIQFIQDERKAQPERGHKYLYRNILATLYYWIMVVERDYFPKMRAEEFIKENPSVFTALNEAEKGKLPGDLKTLCDKFSEAGLFRYSDLSFPVEATRDEYQKIFGQYPDSVSNEGNCRG